MMIETKEELNDELDQVSGHLGYGALSPATRGVFTEVYRVKGWELPSH